MMERLTEKNAHGEGYHLKVSGREHRYDAFDRLAAYENTGLTPEEVAKFAKYERETRSLIKDLNELMAYRMAEQEGRLVVLPCKVGDSVYCLLEDAPAYYPDTNGWYISKEAVYEITSKGLILQEIEPGCSVYVEPFDQIGKTIFLTREEAEAKLKGVADDG